MRSAIVDGVNQRVKDRYNKRIQNKIVNEEVKELERGEIEMFDQYLEMIMTFAYITLFASAFPLGSTITSVFIYLETK